MTKEHWTGARTGATQGGLLGVRGREERATSAPVQTERGQAHGARRLGAKTSQAGELTCRERPTARGVAGMALAMLYSRKGYSHHDGLRMDWWRLHLPARGLVRGDENALEAASLARRKVFQIA